MREQVFSLIAELACYVYAIQFLRLLVQSWWRTRLVFGGFPLGASWQLLRLMRHSRRIYWELLASLLGIFWTLLVWFVFRAIWPRPMIAVFVLILTQSILVLFKSLQPPVALFLAGSSQYAADLLVQINIAVSPLRCVAFLDPKRMHFLQRNAMGENLRTKDPQLWKSIVYRLVEMTPIVVLDTRGESKGILQEAFIMIDPRRASKAVFITDNNGRAPALEAHGIHPANHALTCVTEDELIPLLRDRSESPVSTPQPVSWGTAGHDEVLVPENWEGLPSVLVIMLLDFFDSSEAIRHALSSGKGLLQLVAPCSDFEPQDIRWSMEFSWEFVHNRKLALMIFETSARALIRISFLREVGHRVPRRAARGLGPPWTFEKLNQPEPVWSAVCDFLGDLKRYAEEIGLQVRVVRH
jgi:hypothetical protein